MVRTAWDISEMQNAQRASSRPFRENLGLQHLLCLGLQDLAACTWARLPGLGRGTTLLAATECLPVRYPAPFGTGAAGLSRSLAPPTGLTLCWV